MKNNVLSTTGPDSAVDRAVDRSLERRRAVYADEVRRLVEAAFALIRESGAVEPPVNAIVRRARLSNQAFYKHFRSKHELLVAVLDRGVRTLADYLAHRMDAADSPLDRVREWVRGMAEQACDPGAAEATRPFALGRGRLAESYPEEVAGSERQLTALLREAIAAASEAGELPAVEPEREAESLYHLVMGWMQARLLEGRPTPGEEARRLEAFALAGLRRSDGA